MYTLNRRTKGRAKGVKANMIKRFQFLSWAVALSAAGWWGAYGEEMEGLAVTRTEEGIREALSKIAKEQQTLALQEQVILRKLHERLIQVSSNRTEGVENPVLVEKRKRLAELQEEIRKVQAEIRELILQDPVLREVREAARLDQGELQAVIEKRRALEEKRQLLLREKDAIIKEKKSLPGG